MASTNKTTNYDLSQFIGTDKPAWLADYNSDMSKIDAGIKTAQTTATGADGKADSANTAIGTLANLTTSEKTNLVGAVNEVNTSAGSAQNTANSAYALASANQTIINNITAYFNLSSITTYSDATKYQTSSGFSVDTPNITVAKNSTNSLGKIYGTIWATVSTTGDNKTVTLNVDTGIKPDADITIYNAGLACTDGNVCQPRPLSIIIKTDGTLQFRFNADSATRYRLMLYPSLYFFTDFGDIVVPTE